MKKTVYFLFALGIIIWLGGSLIRNVSIFDIFIPAAELSFKPNYSEEIINYNIYLFVSTSIYTNVAYIVCLSCAFIIIFHERKNMRNEGWLFMSLVLFILTSPIVLYNIYLDFTLSRSVFFHDFSWLEFPDIRTTIFNRYKSTINTVFSGLAYLANVNILAYSVWKPLSKQSPKGEIIENI